MKTSVSSVATAPSTGRSWTNVLMRVAFDQTGSSSRPSIVGGCSKRVAVVVRPCLDCANRGPTMTRDTHTRVRTPPIGARLCGTSMLLNLRERGEVAYHETGRNGSVIGVCHGAHRH